jgi:GTP-binding protein Era
MTKCGFVSIIGAPNAGKSTLLNALVGSKIAIATHKVQTTRTTLRGICIVDDAQVVFVDTPGVFAGKRRLDRAMREAAFAAAAEADVVLHLVDAPAEHATAAGTAKAAERFSASDTDDIVQHLKDIKKPRWLVLNKTDAINKPDLLPLIARFQALGLYDDILLVSASRGSGVKDVRAKLGALMPDGPWHYPEDQISDAPVRVLAAEITREKAFLRLHDELPYALEVETETFEEKKDGSVRIGQTITVARDSQKPIVLGKNGATIKLIGQLARHDMAELLGKSVHLFLNVRVDPDWMDKRGTFSRMGLKYEV